MKLGDFKSAAKSHSDGRVYNVIWQGSATKEDWVALRAEAQASAKRVADFIGLFTQLTFANLAFSYLAYLAPTKEVWWSSWALGICATQAFALYVFLLLRAKSF